eukprot:CAMPEP_0197530808 /NCGR_PEP_ID=MMETSP1318-20131121/33002_1 /TAXON_ID=552666 /ORGANISM="Partenskyella glossopodia, Strain RCC365" /LENGTH=157 /DNA_ID=CAMNT_0043086783 /DNA_START=50 /DNA_END=523 /DNA_ORIENTATION=+
MSAVGRKRLAAERKAFRKDKPFGFFAKPEKRPDGSQNLFRWRCGFPGKKGTVWEGPTYKVILEFPNNYPTNPPSARFDPKIFHPNVFDSGDVCLSILKPDVNWSPSLSVLQVLIGLQTLLSDPNNDDPACRTAANLFKNNLAEYNKKVQQQAKRLSD